jgi:hypothetical protein
VHLCRGSLACGDDDILVYTLFLPFLLLPKGGEISSIIYIVYIYFFHILFLYIYDGCLSSPKRGRLKALVLMMINKHPLDTDGLFTALYRLAGL